MEPDYSTNLEFISTAGLCMASYTYPPCFRRSQVVMAVGEGVGGGMSMAIGKTIRKDIIMTIGEVMAMVENISRSGVDFRSAVAMRAGIHWFRGDHSVDRNII